MQPGEEVSHPDRRQKLPKVQQQHERGEQVHVRHQNHQTRPELEKNYLLHQLDYFFHSGKLFEQESLHISEPDLVYVDAPPHSPCPSSSHNPSPELCPVRLQEVTEEIPV